jgi:class III cytochrome C family protein
MIVLSIYGLIRLIDIGVQGKFAVSFDGSWQSLVFWIEIILLVGLPVLLMAVPRWRRSSPALWLASTAAVLGMGLDRANIAGVMLVRTGDIYLPTIYEIMISLGILSAAILAFLYCLERYNIWEVKWEDPREKSEAPPEFSRPADVWLGTPRVAGRTVYSLIFIVALALGFAMISTERIRSAGAEEIPVMKAHGGDTLFVNGNRDTYGVSFAHEEHIKRLGEKESCVLCHHMNLPLDEQSGCHSCHSMMYTPADAFRHDWHSSPDGGNLECGACHQENLPRTAETAKQCKDCHKDLFPAGTLVDVGHYEARSYTDAMHGQCMSCHQEKSLTLAGKENLAQCVTCHKTDMPDYLPPEIEIHFRDTTFNHVAVPSIDTAGIIEKESSI